LYDYVTHIAHATRVHAAVSLGLSSRGALALMRCAKAEAVIRGSDFVTPDDVKSVAQLVVAHRMILTPEAMLEGRRAEVFLASKSNPEDTSAAAMTAAIDASLRRLKTDWIDLYYIHWPRSGHDMRPRMQALEAARAAGKIRSVKRGR